jgi:site-specific recombinase XerD
LKLPRATIYAFRHSYCTDALAKGISANVLAELVGNSAVTIARNYDHLSKKRESMLAAAADAAA